MGAKKGIETPSSAVKKPRTDWQMDLQIYGSRTKMSKITKKAHAGRGSETIWEIPG
jgi:hypothetical protein